MSRRRASGPRMVLAVGVALLLPSAASAHPAHWLTAWTASQADPGPVSSLVTDYNGTDGLTVRDVVRPTAAGKTIRVRLTNQFGSKRLTFDSARVALASGGAAIVPGSSRRLSFGGHDSVTIPAGGSAVSDPVRRSVQYGQKLTISAYSSKPTGNVTVSGALLHTNYLSEPGDHTSDSGDAAFNATNHWYFVAGVDVRPSRPSGGGVVALGASATLGFGSTPDADRDWPSRLANRLHRRYARSALPVLNAGISGNSLHESSPCYGLNALAREKRDALSQRGVRVVVADIGANDILQPRQPDAGFFGPCNAHTPISANGIIALYKKLIARAHAHGLKVVGATIYPFGAFEYADTDTDAERRAVNRWIRGTHQLDGVIDFDKALADPADSTRLNPVYDSGDGLHPNDTGYAAEATAIDLSMFRPKR